ncbi:MAG: hypothetical protein AAF799_27600 [Myxococcota bacterium]
MLARPTPNSSFSAIFGPSLRLEACGDEPRAASIALLAGAMNTVVN